MKKILLLCSAGMSTSIVVKKMLESAEKRGIPVEIKAVGLEMFQENLDKYDTFLLGPQVKFRKDELNKIAQEVGKKVEVINMMDYGMMKGDKILDFALSLIEE
ncbi:MULTISPECIES: PTS sugar transporter subunit IIB [Cetobacterium]|uniref:PTS sugar transporter subunit IIB n=1 Tax=Cetobacterium TaxID=180162 RepID=UPI00163CF230|nr:MULTISPECIES: PTS sugar transporter subunit IIB [Cetobacterium]MBC2854166.1 PTS sugar transporter subunit IIB [Cetobacterium sp. 2G large]MCQ9625883.1 PTS sugar transporter subunit IIB [Cetobacterium somerae]UPO97509.1 PTS sugar transporter subunit IIB [Cetobacterium somerae]WVJ00614.1 PTS sugar transporter subunit IIB [Cetobacterium somerae]